LFETRISAAKVMDPKPTRRTMLGNTILAAGSAALATATQTAAAPRPADEPFGYCLNTSTIRGQKLSLVAELEIAARAGYRGIEPWVAELDTYVQEGGALSDFRKRADDLGMKVEGVIGFAEWVASDENRRAKGLEQAKRIIEMAAQIGARHLAAPPAGASQTDRADLVTIAKRYRELLTLGEQFDVDAQLELWGFSPVLSKLSEVAFVAVEAAHPRACILADAYHLYKGGSDYQSLRLISREAMHVFHINDYPAKPPRSEITDAQRVFPGDGVAPLGTLFRNLREVGFRGVLSVELFNRDYWNQDALWVARTGLEKTRDAVRKALA
jgi:2-keto-myo-inositol isomerase